MDEASLVTTHKVGVSVSKILSSLSPCSKKPNITDRLHIKRHPEQYSEHTLQIQTRPDRSVTPTHEGGKATTSRNGSVNDREGKRTIVATTLDNAHFVASCSPPPSSVFESSTTVWTGFNPKGSFKKNRAYCRGDMPVLKHSDSTQHVGIQQRLGDTSVKQYVEEALQSGALTTRDLEVILLRHTTRTAPLLDFRTRHMSSDLARNDFEPPIEQLNVQGHSPVLRCKRLNHQVFRHKLSFKSPAFVFQCGWLMDTESRLSLSQVSPGQTGYDNTLMVLPARLSASAGFVRSWCGRWRGRQTIAALRPLRPREKPGTVNGVMVGVTCSEELWEKHQKSSHCAAAERMVPVPIQHFQSLGWCGLPQVEVIYLCMPVDSANKEPSYTFPILQTHLDTCVKGALEAGGEEFAIEWLQSTRDWSRYWLDDRDKPRREWIANPMAENIDRLIESAFNPQHLDKSPRHLKKVISNSGCYSNYVPASSSFVSPFSSRTSTPRSTSSNNRAASTSFPFHNNKIKAGRSRRARTDSSSTGDIKRASPAPLSSAGQGLISSPQLQPQKPPMQPIEANRLLPRPRSVARSLSSPSLRFDVADPAPDLDLESTTSLPQLQPASSPLSSPAEAPCPCPQLVSRSASANSQSSVATADPNILTQGALPNMTPPLRGRELHLETSPRSISLQHSDSDDEQARIASRFSAHRDDAPSEEEGDRDSELMMEPDEETGPVCLREWRRYPPDYTWYHHGGTEMCCRPLVYPVERKVFTSRLQFQPRYFLFGYGSLFSTKSRMTTSKLCKDAVPVRISATWGYRRSWCFQHPREHITALGLEKCDELNACSINGMIYPVRKADLPEFDRRETGYARVEVPRQHVKMLSWHSIPREVKIMTYIPISPNPGAPPGTGLRSASYEAPILQTYIDVCLNGALEYGSDCASEFLATTFRWNTRYWLNDREVPRRPWIKESNYLKIDRILETSEAAGPYYPYRRMESSYALLALSQLVAL